MGVGVFLTIDLFLKIPAFYGRWKNSSLSLSPSCLYANLKAKLTVTETPRLMSVSTKNPLIYSVNYIYVCVSNIFHLLFYE
jgi:hypothetical protein